MFLLLSLFSFICYTFAANSKVHGSFYYYAYGSNLLAKRLHIKNPSAVFYGIGKLEKHRLDFNMFVDAWNGAVATIVPDNRGEVWGTLWKLDANQTHLLDDQEGVHLGWYFAKYVNVITPEGKEIVARTYQETVNPKRRGKGKDLPIERRPSSTYLEVICLGAIESHLPEDYIAYLFSFPTNGQMASKERRKGLGYPF